MILTFLKLTNFRNYERVEVEFTRGLNLIYGNNASGKTNIVESIYYLSLGRSFRTSLTSEMIRNQEDFAVIEGDISKSEVKKHLKAVISKDNRNFFLNGRELKRTSELAESLNVLVFEPKDVNFFKESPRIRRAYLDTNLSKMYPTYLKALSNYNKLLQERNDLLKSKKLDYNHLETIEQLLCLESYEIFKLRKDFLNKITPIVSKIIKSISGESKTVSIDYLAEVDEDNKDEYVNKLKTAFKKALENDLKYRVTSIGIHREDFLGALSGRKIASYASQGERRLLAIALKVAPYFLMDKENRPIVILDDALSELDKAHKENLIKFMSKLDQVFITGTKFDSYDATYYEVSRQNIRRTNYGR